MNEFNTRIMEIRKSLGLSRHAFAKYIGVSYTSLQRYEKGERIPGVDFLTSVCQKCSVSADNLLGIAQKDDHVLRLEAENADLKSRMKSILKLCCGDS